MQAESQKIVRFLGGIRFVTKPGVFGFVIKTKGALNIKSDELRELLINWSACAIASDSIFIALF